MLSLPTNRISPRLHQWKASLPKLQDKADQLKKRNAELRALIQAQLDKRKKKNETLVRTQMLQVRIQTIKEKIQQLKEQNKNGELWRLYSALISSSYISLDADAEAVASRREANALKLKSIAMAREEFDRTKKTILEVYSMTIDVKRKEENDLSEQVMMKRQELIRNLLSVLPVTPVSQGGGACRIINIILPGSGTGLPRGPNLHSL